MKPNNTPIKVDSESWTLAEKCVESYMPDASLIKAGIINANKLVLINDGGVNKNEV